ncbi:MAG: hypothetical protein ABIR28_03935 [Vicinamibacteria bacterium]
MSDSPSPELKALARRAAVHEASVGFGAAGQGAAFGAVEKLRVPLSKLIGPAGFSALLTRAIALGGKDVPWLLSLQVNADGSLEGLEAYPNGGAVARGEVVVMNQLVLLLETFIGPELALGLLRDAWPTMDPKTGKGKDL